MHVFHINSITLYMIMIMGAFLDVGKAFDTVGYSRFSFGTYTKLNMYKI